MVSMKDREKGFEAKFARDEDLRFRSMARRNKLVGLWAADLLGKTGDEADAYAREVVAADFEETGDEDVFRKLRRDLPESVPDLQIRAQMTEKLAQAVEELSGS